MRASNFDDVAKHVIVIQNFDSRGIDLRISKFYYLYFTDNNILILILKLTLQTKCRKISASTGWARFRASNLS